MKYILGLDIGITSVGYGIINEQYEVITSGVRLFSEGTAAENVIRRTSRGIRRRIRRRRHRLDRMKQLLCTILNIGTIHFETDIYNIRKKGLYERLSPSELAAAILHLTKRRGIHYLTAEDLEENNTSGQTTKDIVDGNTKQLKDKYVCEAQLERLAAGQSVRGIENKYLDVSYKKELEALLDKQSNFYPELEANRDILISIYESRRDYEEGPGGENSPTPYGRYRYDKEGKIQTVNLIDLMRGHCTYYPEELRIAKNSYTACLFNLLNDLNNLKIDGSRKLTYEEKKELIDTIVNKGKNINLTQIAKICNVVKDTISGYRVDKNDKPLFTKFEGYQELYNICKTLDCVNIIEGNRNLVDTISDVLTKVKDLDEREHQLIAMGLEKSIAHALAGAKKFKEYHSLSKKAMEAILNDLWQTDKNQMVLFLERGLSPQQELDFTSNEIKFSMENWIVSPVTKRSVNEAIKVINALRKWLKKKEGQSAEFSDIVIELAREKNSADAANREKRNQKKQEDKKKKLANLAPSRHLTKKQMDMLLLLDEQDRKCAYSLRPIDIQDVFTEGMLEIDHIIPRAKSLCDAMYNKVVVYSSENQNKGKRTPFQYFCSGKAIINYDTFKEWVIGNNRFSKEKKDCLLYEQDPDKDLEGFINRNLVDTRYASRKIMNVLQYFFKYHGLRTKVKSINGAMTFAFRNQARLSKDRLNTYAHHAQDALIVAGFANTNIIKKLDQFLPQACVINENGTEEYVDVSTGEVLSDNDFYSPEYIQFIKYISNITALRPKYSHKVDRKPNRQLYDANIKSTRVIQDEENENTFYITKYSNIYDNGPGNNGSKLKAMILNSPEKLLMYRYDKKTFDKFLEVVDYFKDESNPFYAYYKEYGEKLRKYAKRDNGPIINDVKFLDKKLVSHRVNSKQQGKNKSVYLKIKSWRADIYKSGEKYKLINVTYDMLIPIHGKLDTTYTINKDMYERALIAKNLKEEDFCFSIYSGEKLSFTKNGEAQTWIFSCVNRDSTNRIEVKYVDKPSPGNTQKYRMIAIGAVSNFKKYTTDVLGNDYPVSKEYIKYTVNI